MVPGYDARMSFTHSFWRRFAPLLAGGLTEPPKGEPHAMDQKAGEDGFTHSWQEPTPGNIAIKIGLMAMIAVALTGALKDSQIKQIFQSKKQAQMNQLQVLASNLGLDEDH
jgi:hypothetical protein